MWSTTLWTQRILLNVACTSSTIWVWNRSKYYTSTWVLFSTNTQIWKRKKSPPIDVSFCFVLTECKKISSSHAALERAGRDLSDFLPLWSLLPENSCLVSFYSSALALSLTYQKVEENPKTEAPFTCFPRKLNTPKT